MKLPTLDTLLVIVLGAVALALIGLAAGVQPLAAAALALVSSIVGGLLVALRSGTTAPPQSPQSTPEKPS